jgi:hypothetical protein
VPNVDSLLQPSLKRVDLAAPSFPANSDNQITALFSLDIVFDYLVDLRYLKAYDTGMVCRKDRDCKFVRLFYYHKVGANKGTRLTHVAENIRL